MIDPAKGALSLRGIDRELVEEPPSASRETGAGILTLTPALPRLRGIPSQGGTPVKGEEVRRQRAAIRLRRTAPTVHWPLLTDYGRFGVDLTQTTDLWYH